MQKRVQLKQVAMRNNHLQLPITQVKIDLVYTKHLLFIVVIMLLLSSNSMADVKYEQNSQNTNRQNISQELQRIIDDFNEYNVKIPAPVREEVKEYRTKIVKINQQKRELYQKISQEAQNYLAKE